MKTTTATSPKEVGQAAVTKTGGYMPGYVNATRFDDGSVKLTIRPEPDSSKAGSGHYPPAVHITLSREEWASLLETAKAL